jgi:UDP-2,4-diacetamido-2,4,6-trideoxy-beta-L-altropyranose hydrolase
VTWSRLTVSMARRIDTLASSYILRTDGGGDLGFGHVNRCISLADAIQARGGMPEIVLGISDFDVLDKISKAGHDARQLDTPQRFDASATLRGATRAIFDFSHATTAGTASEVARMLKQVHDAGTRTLVIDSIGHNCLAARHGLAVDILAIPYIGAEHQNVLPGPDKEARGAEYFVVNQAFRPPSSGVKSKNDSSRRVLVTAGGSDPTGLTLLFLAALAQIDAPLALRIVIGPGFPDALKSEIENRARELAHNTTLIRAPENLADEILRADLALSASGLTKYELAHAGTPCILVSIDDHHHHANRPFAKLGTCLDAGLKNGLTPDGLAIQVKILLTNPKRQQAMSSAGRALVDGKGSQRLLELLDD